MQRPGSHSSMSELQKRYTERAKLKSEEKDLLHMIEKTKNQLAQLQAEAVEIKAKIKPKTQKENNSKAIKNNKIDNQQLISRGEQEEIELDLDSTNDVLDKMLKGQFSVNDENEITQ